MDSFIKHNQTPWPDQLQKEADGLQLLTQSLAAQGITEIAIPRVIQVDKHTLHSQKIQACAASAQLSQQLGIGLARLHQQQHPHYGLGENNYIGLAVQENGWSDHWGKFFVEKRLQVQIKQIGDPALRDHFNHVLNQRADWLEDWLSEHCTHPSLVHGDLWSGNVLFDKDQAWLIDPAVYYGDREVDITMTELFGGFSSDFYRSYAADYPLSRVYQDKKIVYNLYHYLNHYNLFGSAYLRACQAGFDWLAEPHS